MIGSGALLKSAKEFLPKLLAWLLPKIPSLASSLFVRLGLGVPKWVYRNWLLSRYRDMPFIYQDLKLEVLNDFVELRLSSLDSSSLDSQHQNSYDVRSAIDKMRDYRRALFLGDGGVGKTTFFRFITLNMVGVVDGVSVVNESESIIPFFIPLKALDNSSDHPLVDALLENNPYLGKDRRRALLRLMGLVRSQRAAFFLDGFDEIPYAGGNQSLLREISALFSALDQPAQEVLARSEYAQFYRDAWRCRIYLSSRREFFLSHPVNAPRDVPRWEITGLGDKRASLVGNIFRHYKKVDFNFFSEVLNVETFMNQLFLAKDPGFIQLSSNPLFLTVICFVYVNQIRMGGRAGEMFGHDSSILIETCIQLLLSGIDEAKIVGLSRLEAQALMSRRSAWPDQKFLALQYVASDMYLKNAATLSLKDLTDLLLRFFHDNSYIEDADQILRGLSGSELSANMAMQLTYSGVLVVIDRRHSGPLYDFPHRRFKENLAVSYFSTNQRIEELVDRIRDPSFHELILLVASTRFGWNPIMKALKETIGNGDRESMGPLLVQVMSKAQSISDAQDVVKGLLDLAVRECDKRISIPSGLQSYLPRISVYRNNLITMLALVISNNNTWGFGLIAEAIMATSAKGERGALDGIQKLLPLPSDLDWQLLYVVDKYCESYELQGCIDWVLSKRSMASVDDSIAGIISVALIGKPGNRNVVMKGLELWFKRSGDSRASFFENREKFNEVVEIFSSKGKPQNDQVRLLFSRGAAPNIVRPWQ